jgi:hypothetical protein
MPSRVFNSIVGRAITSNGGRGQKAAPTRVLRVPESHLEELDNLVESYRAMAEANPKSPRYDFLNRFLDELDEILKPHID